MTPPTKTPIDPSEIRAGDLIRWEPGAGVMSNYRAVEYKAGCDGQQQQSNGSYYLLDRPTPPVSLPTEPTLGWLTWFAGEESSGLGAHRTLLGIYHRMGNGDITDEAAAGAWGPQDVIAFTRATAVPIEALDRLRSDVADWPPMSPNSVLGRFLAAVDEATS